MASNTVIPNPAASNEGQSVILPDGRCFRFIWSGSITETRPSIFRTHITGIPHTSLSCRRCDREFTVGEMHYNRRAPNANRKARLYCLACAVMVGLIEERRGPFSMKMAIAASGADAPALASGEQPDVA